MKKTVTALLTLLCVSLLCSTALIGCDSDTQEPVHTHTYATEWSHDDANHWHSCTDENCTEVSDKAQHTFENNVCTACGYKTVEITPTHIYTTEWSYDDTNHWHNCTDENCTEVSDKAQHIFENNVCAACGYEITITSINEVTKNQFDAALSFSDTTSLTVKCDGTTGDGKTDFTTTMYFDGNKTKITSYGMSMFVEENDTFAYCYSCDSEHNKWYRTKIEKNDEEYSSTLLTFEDLKIKFSNFDFADFSYANGYYEGVGSFAELTFDVKFQFKNGRLVYCRAQYKQEYVILNFSAYNETNVSLPANYEDIGSVTPTPDPTTSWSSYFEFDNVTVSLSSSTYYPDYDMTMTSSESIKVQGNKWLWKTTDYFYNSCLYNDFDVYFDGTNAYVDGIIDNNMDMKNVDFFRDADLSAYKSSFIETSSGVFEADEISAYGIYTYKDVRLVISNGKISSISYSMEFSYSGTSYTKTVEYIFSDWGETVIDGDKYTQQSAWASYFDFENVTITEILQYSVGGTSHSLETSWQVDNNSWACNKTMAKVDGIEAIVNRAYYDGTNCYLNGDIVSESDIYPYHYLSGNILGDLIGCEHLFNSTMQGSKIIYSAESITLYNVILCKDVELTVDNGKLIKLTYNKDNACLDEDTGTIYAGTFTITFSNYGTTVVNG